VTAERTVNVSTTGDDNAFLGLAPARGDEDFVSVGDDSETIQINLDGSSNANGGGLNRNAETTFRNLVTVSNNGTQNVDSLILTMEITGGDDNVSADDTFEFTVSQNDGNEDQDTVSNGESILTGENDVPSSLGSGSSINFGIVIDLLDGGTDDGDLPSGLSYDLTIEAQTANSNTGSGS
jgi:hypothetical protein